MGIDKNRLVLLGKYETLRASKDSLALELEKINYPATALKRFLDCGSPASDGELFLVRECGCGVETMLLLKHCDNKNCPDCSSLRSRRIIDKYLPTFEKIYNLRSRAYSVKKLEICPANYDTLEAGLVDIKSSLNRLRHTKFFSQRVKGAMGFIEVTYNHNLALESKPAWNLHLHLLIYSLWIPHKITGRCLDCGHSGYLTWDSVDKSFFCPKKSCNSKNLFHNKDSSLTLACCSSFRRDVIPYIKRVKTIKGSLYYVSKYANKPVKASKSAPLVPLDIQALYMKITYKKRHLLTSGLFYDGLDPLPNHRICFKCNEPIIYYLEYKSTFDLIYDFSSSSIDFSFSTCKPVKPPPLIDRWVKPPISYEAMAHKHQLSLCEFK